MNEKAEPSRGAGAGGAERLDIRPAGGFDASRASEPSRGAGAGGAERSDVSPSGEFDDSTPSEPSRGAGGKAADTLSLDGALEREPLTSSQPLVDGAASAARHDRVVVTEIPVDNLTADQTLETIKRLVAEPGCHYMAVVNAAKMVAARQDSALRRILESADIVTADGMSVVWASRLMGQPLAERVTGIDMLARLVDWAAEQGVSIFFLGAKEDALAAAVDYFKRSYPALKVAGYQNGYFAETESESIAMSIKASSAELLFVGMGSPAQEKWIAQYAPMTGVRFAMGVGGSFDHVSGRVQRAPVWMQRAGLEWLHRLAREPRRMWRRYLIGNAKFVYLVMTQRLMHK